MPAPRSEPLLRALTLAPHLSEASRGRALIAQVAARAGFSEERVFDITVACSEAIANAIEHSPVKGEVEVRTFLRLDRLEVEVEGPGEFQAPDRLHKRETRGLGLPLMAKFSDHLALYSGPAGGTLVTLTFYLPGFEAGRAGRTLPPSIGEIIEENELFSAIAANSSAGLYVLDAELRFRWANAAFSAFLDEAQASLDLTGLHFAEVIPGARDAGLLDRLRAVSETGIPDTAEEFEFCGLERGVTYWRWRGIPLKHGSDGPPYGVFVVVNEVTDRRELVESEERLRVLMNHNPSLVFMKDESGRYVYLNAAYEREFVHSKDWYGKTDFDFWPPESAELFRANDREVLRTGRVHQFVEDSVGLDGTRHYWLNYKFPFAHGNGATYVGGIGIDVTDRQRLEETVKRQRDEMQHLIRHAATGIYEIDFRGPRFVSVNDFMCTYIGYSREELLAANPMDLLDEESQARFRERVAASLTGHRVDPRVEYTFRTKQGEQRWAVLHVTPTFEDGHPVGAFVVGQDVTERKQAEEALRETKEKYQALVETNVDFIWEIDGQGRYAYCSPQMETLWGLRPADMLGRSPFDLMPPEARERTEAMFREFVRSAAPFAGVQVVSYDGEGEIIHVEISGVPILDDAGTVIGFRGVTRDITERKQAEEAVRESQRILRHSEAGHHAMADDRLVLLEQSQNLVEDLMALNEELRQQRGELEESKGELLAHAEELRLLEGQREEDRRLEDVLARIAMTAVTELTEDAVIQSALREGCFCLGAQLAEYYELSGTEWQFRQASEDPPPEAGEETRRATSSRPTWSPRAFQDGMPLLLGRKNARADQTTSVLIPVLPAGRLTGVLRFTFADPRSFEPRHREFFTRLSTLVSLALQSARLMESRRFVSESLQEALVTLPTDVGGLRLGHLYRSATEAARVGGDFYDVFEVKAGKIAILIGDVAGHGVAAARTATLVKDIVHAFAHQSVRTAEVLRRANGLLIEKDMGGFVTAFLAILDQETGSLRYSSAGHPETLLRRASGGIEILGHGSTPLGVDATATWKSGEVWLQAGDLLLLYTDGVIEARQNGELFGQERLTKILERKRLSVERLPGQILDRVLAFSGGTLSDDIAVLALLLTQEPPRPDGAPAQQTLLG